MDKEATSRAARSGPRERHRTRVAGWLAWDSGASRGGRFLPGAGLRNGFRGGAHSLRGAAIARTWVRLPCRKIFSDSAQIFAQIACAPPLFSRGSASGFQNRGLRARRATHALNGWAPVPELALAMRQRVGMAGAGCGVLVGGVARELHWRLQLLIRFLMRLCWEELHGCTSCTGRGQRPGSSGRAYGLEARQADAQRAPRSRWQAGLHGGRWQLGAFCAQCCAHTGH